MLAELFKKARSYRRFDAGRVITGEELYSMVESARCSASSANRQRIRFALVNTKDMCDKIFENVAFAGYLKEWAGPTVEERPTAYIVIMTKEEKIISNYKYDLERKRKIEFSDNLEILIQRKYKKNN